MRAADQHVNAPTVHVEVGGAEAGDRVDDEQSVGISFLEQLGDAGYAVADASGGFSSLHEHGAGLNLERLLDRIEREGFAIGGGDDLDIAAERLTKSGPAFAELAGREDENAVARRSKVRHRCFHRARAGACEQQNVILGADELLELLEYALEEGAELRGAVVHIGSGHGELGGGKQGRGTGSKEAYLANHAWMRAFVVLGFSGKTLWTLLYRAAGIRVLAYNRGWPRREDKAMSETAGVAKRIDADIVAAMRAREAGRVEALRMLKAAIRSKEIDKRESLTEAEAQAVLTTLIKQRRESVEQFTKGNRPELAAKEAGEIELIEAYMPKAAGAAELKALVESTLEALTASGERLGPKEMGMLMKAVQERIKEKEIRADGRQVSELVKAALTR